MRLIFINLPGVNPGYHAARLMGINSFKSSFDMNEKVKSHIETHKDSLENIHQGSKNVLPYLNCAAVGGAISNCPETEKKRKYVIKHLHLQWLVFLWRGKVSINVRH